MLQACPFWKQQIIYIPDRVTILSYPVCLSAPIGNVQVSVNANKTCDSTVRIVKFHENKGFKFNARYSVVKSIASTVSKKCLRVATLCHDSIA